ncbi:UbiA family prenyltransferase [Methylobacterium sp. J-088]|uniref:UbiA family prenyltransferase n=1 Tax=Methylobacterium sp. J-088 TaxID=2836664 RepID=UPI001FBB3734|nr:UbiA family prenyltransferase [Methylobacterium sp. J-088]MCJ2065761.1 UbiA family prenyltransferase [Methylobacterium sp. J-088]
MSAASAAIRDVGTNDVPLVVDVDGTLIKSDLLYESALQFLARFPLEAWRLPHWLFSEGKAALKQHLSERADPSIATIPLREETVALIRDAQAAGRPVYIASASDRRLVEALAERVGGIAGVFSTEAGVNLAGDAKARRLVAEFGEKGFDYVGDAAVDFPVWRASRNVLAVAHGGDFSQKVRAAFPDARIVAESRVKPRDVVRALRPHQWAKNALVFVGLVTGHHFDAASTLASLTAFVCFCMAASSAYLINDLLDLPADRIHPRKSRRPFASGAVPVLYGVVLAAILAAGAFVLSFGLPVKFSLALLIYLVLTLAYSFYLKRRMMIDIVVLGGLYAIRVFGGVAALGLPQTPWLLMFSLFLFTSLAIVKRCSELTANHQGEQPGEKKTLAGRGYLVEDLRVLFPFGAAAGYGSVFVFALYMSSPDVAALYTHPNRLWLICPLLIYWISRMFLLSNRDQLHSDPVVYALTDRISLATGACVAAVLAISL